MKTITYCGAPRKDSRGIRSLRIKLPNYLIKRKISVIKEKILARKYGTIYLRKVFGKYYPSECRRYYEKKLLRRFFDKLKAHWFEEKEVYRLLYKADFMFNEKLMRKTFNGWHSFAMKSKIVKQQALTVKNNYDGLMLKNILCTWKTTTNCNKMYKLIRSNAIELYYFMYTFMLLLQLAKYYSDEIEENLLGIKSILRGRFFIQRKCFRKWKMYIFQQRTDRILRSKAVEYHRSKVSMIYLSHWQRFVRYKRTKHQIVQLCTSLYEDGLLKRVVQLWKNKTTSRIVERKNMLLASQFHEDLIKRKLLKTWRRYVKHKLQGRSLKHKANFFHTMRLKQKVFNALSRHVTCRKNTKLATQKLKLFYRRLLITSVWNKWTKIIEERNDFDLRDKLLIAASFYKRKMMKKYLTDWIRYNTSQQREKALKLKALDLCNIYYCKQYLNVWKIAYRKKRRVAMLDEEALKFFNDSLLQNAISQWIKSYNYVISMKTKYEKSILHHERKITSKCFVSWISFCNNKIRTQNLAKEATEYYLEMLKRKIFNSLSMNIVRMKMKREKQQVAADLYKKNLAIKAFADWREYCIHSKELKKKVKEFDVRIQNNLKRRIIVQWKLYLHHKKCSYKKTLMSVTHTRRKACARMFERLKNYVIYRKEKRLGLAYLRYGVEGIQQNLTKIYFQHWRMARLNILKEKCKIFHADEFHRSHLKYKYLKLWQTFLRQHRMKNQYQSDLNNRINYFILKKSLRIWYARYQALLYDHSNETWVSKIWEMKIRYRYFTAWKYFTEIRTREKKEIDNAKEYHKKLVMKEGLQHLIKLFLFNTESRYETKLKNIERNSSHKFELLKKYFIKWHRVVSNKTENRLKVIKDVTPTNFKIDDRKNVSNIIPRFIIPEFMRNEIKLRFGIGRYSSQIPIDVNGRKILQSEQILTADKPFSNKKSNKIFSHSRMDVKSRGKIQLNLENDSKNYDKLRNINVSRPRHLKQNTKIIRSDSLESDSDSAKTYIVQNPSNYQNFNKTNLSRTSFRSDATGKKYEKENDHKLSPPAAFYVPFNK